MNDFEAAWHHSQVTYKSNDDYETIHELLEKGFYIVVSCHARYCAVTDACLPGEDKYFLGAFKKKQEAERFLGTFEYEDPDTTHKILEPLNEVNFATYASQAYEKEFGEYEAKNSESLNSFNTDDAPFDDIPF